MNQINIDWKLLASKLNEIGGYHEALFLKNHIIKNYYVDEKISSSEMKFGLDIINKVQKSNLINNKHLKIFIENSLNKKINKESEVTKISEILVKSSPDCNYVKILFSTTNSAVGRFYQSDILVLFETLTDFILIGICSCHPYIFCSQGWEYGNSDGGGPQNYFDEKENAIKYCWYDCDLIKQISDNELLNDTNYHNNGRQLTNKEFDIYIVNQYRKFCMNCYH